MSVLGTASRLLLLSSLLGTGQPFNQNRMDGGRLPSSSDMGEEPESQPASPSALTLGTLLPERPLLIDGGHSSQDNRNHPKNASPSETPIQPNFLLSADRSPQEGRMHTRDRGRRVGLSSVVRGAASVGADVIGDEKGEGAVKGEVNLENSEGSTLLHTDRKRRDIYSLIDKALRKRHQLESDEDIQRLLAALATIRDYLETNQVPNQFAPAYNNHKDATTKVKPKIDLAPHKALNHKSLPTLMRGPSNRPVPPHPKDYRNKPRWGRVTSTETEASGGSVDYPLVNEGGLALAVRTSPRHTENELQPANKAPFYPEFNPTGW